MRINAVWPAILLFLGLLLPAPEAHAIDMVDPKLIWRSLRTEHFEITYHDGEEDLAQRIAPRAELIHRVLTAELEWTPKGRTQVVLVDRQDDPNGYATPIPYRTIVLYVTAPDPTTTLDNYEDWLTILLAHEYTHILHLDTMDGLPALARRIMGSIISPNSLLPRWIIEGFATLQETRQTLGGRGAASWTEMMLRTAALEGRFPEIDQADGSGSMWPGGQLPYLFGVGFQQWVAGRYGERGWTAVSHRNGRSVIPYLLNRHVRKVFGKSVYQLWAEWRREVLARAREVAAERRKAGITPEERLSRPGEAVAGMRVSPDGKRVVYSASTPDDASKVIAIDLEGNGRKELDRQRLPSGFTFSGDGRQVYYSAPALYDLYSRYEDLYAFDFLKDKVRRVTRGERARDPEFSPDGAMLLYVSNRLGQTNLAYTQVDGQVKPLTRATDYSQFATPRFAPDGKSFVASVWKAGGYRDLYRFDREGRELARITADRAHDIDPAFSPDGRYLLFSSDRDGIANIYALEAGTDALYRVTNVLGGAFQPSVTADRKTLVFLSYHAEGMVVVKTPFDAGRWTSVERAVVENPPTRTPPLSLPALREAGIAGQADAKLEPALREAGIAGQADAKLEPKPIASGPYRPLPTLLPPRFVAPLGYLTEAGAVGGLYTYGSDVLSKHLYSATLSYRTDDHFLGYSASYTNQQLPVALIAGLSSYSISLGRLEPEGAEAAARLVSADGRSREETFYRAPQASYTYFEVRTQSSLGLRIPFSRISQAYVRYLNECRAPLEPIPGEVDGSGYRGSPFVCPDPLSETPAGYAPDDVPARGRFAGLSIDYRWNESERYARSISPEHGTYVDLAATVQSRYLGGDYDRALATLEVRRYLSVPRVGPLRNQVLALRLASGVALGDDLNEPTFRLGGSFGENPAVLFPDGYYPLRGYPVGVTSGEFFALGSAEFRFPIWQVDRGLGTWPFFLRAFSASIFADAGRASELEALGGLTDRNEWRTWLEGFKLGAGGELRTDLVVSYGLPLTVRTGIGIGFSSGGYGPDDLRGWYLQIGSYF